MKNNTLIDKYMQHYTFSEYHETVANCPIPNVYHVAKDFDLSKSKSIKILFTMRGLPTNRMNLKGFIDDMGFTALEENFPHEFLIGFWTRSKIVKISNYEDFINNSINPWIKTVWNFRFDEVEANKTIVSTETRILCVAPFSRYTFGLYWLVIKPFSGLIRKKMLKIIKDDSESLQLSG
jgi:hypothetical protein